MTDTTIYKSPHFKPCRCCGGTCTVRVKSMLTGLGAVTEIRCDKCPKRVKAYGFTLASSLIRAEDKWEK